MNNMINGRYHLHNKLGQGGMGIVHRATDRLTGETVALKQVFLPVEQIMFSSRPVSQTNRELRLALAHEFQTLAGLRHPNIISVLDYGFDENQQPFFTMSYLENAQTIVAAANGRSVPQKVNLLIQTLEALAYLHRRGILHRDLKPDNVLVVGDTVRVLDFGLAAAKEQATESVGSWLYMAPEVLLGQPATEASDLYAVGVLAYRLLAGTHPFNIYAEDTIGEILEGEPDWGKLGSEEELTAVVHTLLAKKPNDRYPTANQAIAAFYRALGQPLPQETAVIRESYLQAATFIGREAEMSQLTEALTQAKRGQGSAWLIGGESGVGKSRLLRELQTQALVQGFQLLRGQSIQDGGGTPYHLWREPLRQLIMALPDVDDFAASVLYPLIPDISQLLGREIHSAPELPSDAARIRLFTIIAQLFRQTKRPLLLILEDLHWAEESLLVIPYLTRLLEEYPILFVGSYRHDERPNLPEQLPNLTTLQLSRLTQEEMADLSFAILGQAGQKQAVLELLQKETEGNTFFVVEVVRALAETAGRLGNIGEMELPEHLFPDGIQSIVAQRLSHLPETALPLLRQAAVAGRELDMLLIQALAVNVDVDKWWLPLCNDAAVLEVQNGRWQFTHDKIRQGILLTLPPEQRTTIHAQVALKLTQVYSQNPEMAATIAHHWHGAGDEKEELVYRIIAAKFTLEQFVYDEALTHIERALILTPKNEMHTRFDLLHKQVQAVHVLGHKEAEAAILPHLTTLAEKIGDPKLIVSAYTRQIDYQNDIGEYQAAAELAQSLADRFEKQNAETLFELYPAWAWGFLQQGKLQETLSVLDRAALYLDNSQTTYEVRNLNLRGTTQLRMANHQAAIRSLEKAINLAQMIDNKSNLIAALNNLANVYNDQKLPYKAMGYLEQALRLNQQVGDQRLHLPLLINLSINKYFLYDYQAAINLTQQALTLAQTIGHQRNMIIASMNLGGMYGKLGKHDEGLKYARIGLNLLETTATEDIYLLGWVWFHIGENLYYLKQWGEAQTAYHQALTFQQQRGLTQQILETQAWLARTILDSGDAKLAQAQLDPVLTFLEEVTEPSYDHLVLYFVSYEVLSAHQPVKAAAYLSTAYNILQTASSTLSDDVARQTFWQEHVLHREIVQAYDAYIAKHGAAPVFHQPRQILGTINGRYLLHEKLGQGGMGIVHRATDRLTGETVALKQVFLPVEQIMFSSRPVSQTNRELRLALAHEFQTLAGLRHPNIISVLDYGFDENQQPFFTMSYLAEAQTILAAANGRSAPEKATLLIQMLEALAYLHRRGILHRDLKPDNVLVVGDTVRVLDFGLAAAKEQATESVGSWLYMAPEVLLGQPATEASDLYAVGVLAYRLLAGTHPFNIYAEDVIGEILEGEPDWSKVQGGEELTAVVRTLLAKKPDDRYPTANQAIAAFYRALGQPLPQETAVIRESYLQAAQLIGREAEMAQLTDAVQQAKAGHGSAWLIGGESGVGKSRLINELRTYALVNGFLVLNGQGLADDGGSPYQLWKEPVHRLLLTTTALDALSVGVLAPLVPDIAQLTKQTVPLIADLTGQAAQQRLYQTITRLFQQQSQPILLLLEDLQWGGESLGMLAALTQTISEQLLVIVGTYRDDEQPNLPSLLPRMTVMPLHRLPPVAMQKLSWAMLGDVGNKPEVLALLQRETEGNAFFAVEIIRALAHNVGRLVDIGQQPLPQKLWPQGIQSLVQQRLNRLSVADHALLQLVGVAGRVLDMPLVEALARAAGLGLVEPWIIRCHEAAILDVQNGRWQFNHDKIRESILTLLSPAQLIDAHRHIARTLEAVYPPATRPSARLAYHWGQAGEREAQAHYALQAGKEAALQFANQDAIHFYTLALELCTSATQQVELLFARESVYERVGQRAEQAADLATLDELVTAVNQPALHRQLLLRHIIYAYTTSNFAKAEELEQKLIEEAQAAQDLPTLMAAHNYYGLTLRDTSNNQAAAEHLNVALSLSRQLQDQQAENDILTRLGLQSLISGNQLQAQHYYEESLALALARHDTVAQGRILNSLGLLAYEIGDLAVAYQYCQDSLHTMQNVGDRLMEGRIRNNLGLVAYELGQYAHALDAFKESIQINHEVGDRAMEAGGLSNLGLIFTQVGLYDKAIELYHRSLEIAQAIGHKISEAGSTSSLGMALLGQGKLKQAEAYCQQALTIAQEIGYPQLESSIWVERGRVAQAKKSWAKALDFYTHGYTIGQSLNVSAQSMGCQAGIALALWHLGQRELAQEQALPVADYILQHRLTGYWNPMAAALNIYYVLEGFDMGKAKAIVYKVHDSLQYQAAQMVDEQMRESFLESVLEHRTFRRLHDLLKIQEEN